MLLTLLSLTASAQDFSCGLAAGAVAGFIDVRDMWEFVNRGPFLPTGSPMLAMGCQPPVHAGAVAVSAELAPWPIHFRLSEDRKIRQWLTGTASWSAVLPSLSLGGAVTGGSAGVGLGAVAGIPIGERGTAVDLRVLNFLTDPQPNLQLVVLYSFRPMNP